MLASILNGLIRFSLLNPIIRHRPGAVLLLGYGSWQAMRLPIDVIAQSKSAAGGHPDRSTWIGARGSGDARNATD